MTMLSRLGLGTVQFGHDYGVSNRGGRPDEREVAAILARAAMRVWAISILRLLMEMRKRWWAGIWGAATICASSPRNSGADGARIEARHRQHLLDTLAASLDRLKVDAVHGLLVHQSGDLAKPGWQHLVDAMAEAKLRGWTSRIGASIYNDDQLALVESRFHPEIVQLPLNVLDRRPIVSGTLARLKSSGIEVHARSAFLQGLLLMEPDELPEFFAPVRQKIVGLRGLWRKRGLSALNGCLAFALQRPEVRRHRRRQSRQRV